MNAFDYSLLLLNKKQYFENEIKTKLLNKFEDEEIARECVESLRNLKFIDDDKFITFYINHLIENKHYGIYKIKDRLLSRGLTPEYINHNIDKVDNKLYENSIFQYIQNLLRREDCSLEKIVKKCQSKGWEFSSIEDALKRQGQKVVK